MTTECKKIIKASLGKIHFGKPFHKQYDKHIQYLKLLNKDTADKTVKVNKRK